MYQITEEGRLELVVQRDAALEVVFGSADPLSVVLLFAAGEDASELAERLAARRHRVAAQLEAMTAERERLTAAGRLVGRWRWPRSAAASCGSRRSCSGMRNSSVQLAAGRPGVQAVGARRGPQGARTA